MAAGIRGTDREGNRMKELEERIAREGIVRQGNVLKVDSFLNHRCDVELYSHMAQEWR